MNALEMSLPMKHKTVLKLVNHRYIYIQYSEFRRYAILQLLECNFQTQDICLK